MTSCEGSDDCPKESVATIHYKNSNSASNIGFVCIDHLQFYVKPEYEVQIIQPEKSPYWVPDWRDIEKEWAKREDVSDVVSAILEGFTPDKNGVRIFGGLAYKITKKYVRRMPVEIYQSRKRWGKPKGYWETRDAVKKPMTG